MPTQELNPADAHAITPEQYIRANYETCDRLAVVLLNGQQGETIQRIATAEVIASPRFQAWLRHKNAHGSDIYISQNVLNEDAEGRTKADVKAIRHVYLDLDRDGNQALSKIEASSNVPKPNFIINTSPGKYQVIWKVEGMGQAEAEGLMRAIVRDFGGDPAATVRLSVGHSAGLSDINTRSRGRALAFGDNGFVLGSAISGNRDFADPTFEAGRSPAQEALLACGFRLVTWPRHRGSLLADLNTFTVAAEVRIEQQFRWFAYAYSCLAALLLAVLWRYNHRIFPRIHELRSRSFMRRRCGAISQPSERE